MKKLIAVIAVCLVSITTFATEFIYSFQIVSVTEPGDAKRKIIEIRDLLGVKTITFNNESDTFEIQTHLDFELEELLSDFSSIGIDLVGVITKINNE